jgi:hypothetical protein
MLLHPICKLEVGSGQLMATLPVFLILNVDTEVEDIAIFSNSAAVRKVMLDLAPEFVVRNGGTEGISTSAPVQP